MSIVIGTLRIDLECNTATFTEGMEKVEHISAKTANDVKRSLQTLTAVGIGMGTAIAAGTAELVHKSMEAIVGLEHMSQAAGTTVDRLSELNYAAQRVGLPAELLVKGMERLAKASFQAQNGNVALANIFQRLGIHVTDSNGHLKDTGILMDEVAPKFAKMADGAGKTAIAQQLFGKGGAAMIPFLNEWGAHMDELKEKARQFGMVIGPEVAERTIKFHETLNDLKVAWTGFGLQLTAAALPALTAFADKLQEVAVRANIPELAKTFGAGLTGALTSLVGMMDFAMQHAHALKLVLEGLVALKVANFAIPLIGQIAAGGIGNIAGGIEKLSIGLFGLKNVLPVLGGIGGWLKAAIPLMFEAGGASYVLGGAISAIGGPAGIAIAAIVGLGIALYKFRNSTFELEGTTYKLRDTWNAVWIEMGWGVDWLKGKLAGMVAWIESIWSSFTDWLGKTFGPAIAALKSLWSSFTSWFKGQAANIALGMLTVINLPLAIAVKFGLPNFKAALDAAKKAREDAEKASKTSSLGAPGHERRPPGEQPDTSGLGVPKKDVYGELIAKLKGATEAQNKYLAVLHGTPEEIQKVAIAEKADAEILKITNELIDQHVMKKGQKLALDKREEITANVAAEMNAKAAHEYLSSLVNQQIGAQLATTQIQRLAQAHLEGDEAVRQAAIDNEILALKTNKLGANTAEAIKELATLRDLLAGKSNAGIVEETNKEIYSLQQRAEMIKITSAAAMQQGKAVLEATIAAKTYALNQQIANATDTQVIATKTKLRDAIEQNMRAEYAEALAKEAKSLLSPIAQYDEEIKHLKELKQAFEENQKRSMDYAESLQLAIRVQDAFNKLTDQTVNLLLRFGTAKDGVKAFFLDMQKQAQTSASIIYDALHSAFEKISDNLTELVTGGKTNFAKMFQDIGKQMVNSTIKAGLQTALGKIGEKLGVHLPGKAPTGTEKDPLWVRMAGMAGMALPGGGSVDWAGGDQPIDNNGLYPGEAGYSGGGILSKLKGLFGGGGGGISGMLASLFGKGGGGATSDLISTLMSSLPMMAEGGTVSPDSAYLVGERGPEILMGASGQIASNSASSRMLSGNASNHYYTIDARGTDPVLTEQRTRAAIIAAHNSAVSNSLQVSQEHLKRTPQQR